ncbi:MAG TPA: DivIVA domain-containing protein [Streptosporangiaceae bacterium]|jgi:DivIVA domain-containing protein
MSHDRFTTILRGYRRADVDAFLARVDGTLGRAPLTAQPVTAEEIAATRFAIATRGYDPAAVDRAMAEAAAVLGGTAVSGYTSFAPPAAPTGYAPPPPAPYGDDADGARDRMIARLRDVRLSTTRMRAGYATDEVDGFLQRAAAAVAGMAPPITAAETEGVVFSTSRLRPGYDQEETDALLDELAAYLRRYGGGAADTPR